MAKARVRLVNGVASELELGTLPPDVYALQLANAMGMWVEYSTFDKKWSDWTEVYPTKIIVPLTPAVALARSLEAPKE